MIKDNLYKDIHELKKPILDVVNYERGKRGIIKFNQVLEDSTLQRAVYGLTTETSATNINSVLLILDKLGYDLVPVKRKDK